MKDALGQLTSKEPHQIWLACGTINQCWDRAEMRGLARHVGAIRKATKGIDLGGAFRPNALQLTQALARLEHAQGDGCFCRLYPTADQFRPEREADNARIDILERIVNKPAWETDYLCRCTTCSTAYRVKEVAGGHIPSYDWRIAG